MITAYVEVQFRTLRQKKPADFNATLSVGPHLTTIAKYLIEGDTGDPDGENGLDYSEFQVGSVRLTKPADYDTRLTFETEIGTSSYSKWRTQSFPDDFVIPDDLRPEIREFIIEQTFDQLEKWAEARDFSAVTFYLDRVNEILDARSLHDLLAGHLEEQFVLMNKALNGEITPEQLLAQSDALAIKLQDDLAEEQDGLPPEVVKLFTHLAFVHNPPIDNLPFSHPDDRHDVHVIAPKAPQDGVAYDTFIQNGIIDEVFVGSSFADVARLGAGDDVGYGGAGDDQLNGGSGNDKLYGGPGNDTLIEYDGTDTLDGGEGVDTVDYSQSGDNNVVVNFNTGQASGAAINSDRLISIENVIAGGGRDQITGNAAANRITGGRGNDTIDGGEGSDHAIFAGPRTAYKITVVASGVQVVGPDGTDIVKNIEFLGFDDVTIPAPAPPHWLSSVDIGPHPAGWLPVLTGDYNNDATSDLLWFNATSRNLDLWKIANGAWAGSADIGAHPAGWQPSATGDFNKDGSSDVLWYNPSNGNVDIWKIANGQWAGSVDVGSHPLGWQPIGGGDFNKDGTSDVLWYNPTSGNVDIWKLSNGQWAGSQDIGSHPLGWQPVGTGDFDGDGTSDVLWYNPTTRNVDLWKVSNGQWAGSVDIGAHPAGWTPAGIGDFNGDGTSDLAWFNAATGGLEVWLIANGHWLASVDIGAHPSGWAPAGIGDFDHNDVSDILWREASTNRVETWLLTT